MFIYLSYYSVWQNSIVPDTHLFYKVIFLALFSLRWGSCSECVELKNGTNYVQWGIIIRPDYICLAKSFKTNKQTKKSKQINKSWKSASGWTTNCFLQFCVENSKHYEESTHFEMKILTFYISLYWNDFLSHSSNIPKFKIWMIIQFYLNKVFKMAYERMIV